MVMPSQGLRVLVMDESNERAAMLESAIMATGEHAILHLRHGVELIEAVQSFKPDVVLIDVNSPTRDTLEQLTTVREQAPRPVVMFCQDQSYQTIEAAIQSGVSAYVTDGIDPGHVRPAIATAMATFQSFQSLRDELDQTRTTLHERKTIDRAKAHLMETQRLSEEKAYRAIRSQAMNSKQRLVDVARQVLANVAT